MRTGEKCTFCDLKVDLNTNSIQCCACSTWCHFECTELPPYQLYMLHSTRRLYTCQKCVSFYELSWHGNCKVVDCTNAGTQTLSSDFETNDFCIQTDLRSSDKEKDSDTVKSDEFQKETIQFDEKNIQTDPYIDPYQQKVYESLQDGLVKVMNQVAGIGKRLNSEEESKLKLQVLNKNYETLTQKLLDNESPSKSKSSHDSPKPARQADTCSQDKEIEAYKKKLNLLEKDNEDMKVKLKKQLHEATLEKEIMKSRLETELLISMRKLEASERSVNFIEKDLECLEERYSKKCSEIIETDTEIKSLKSYVSKLEDEILSLKLHSCNATYELPSNVPLTFNTASTNSKVSEAVNMNNNRGEIMNSDTSLKDTTSHVRSNTHNNQKKQDSAEKTSQINNHSSKSDDSASNISDRRQSDRPRNNYQQQTQRQRKKQVLLIGTSNTKFLSSRYIAGQNTYVKKVTKYTTKEATSYIKDFEGDEPDIVIYQVTCNDIETQDKTTILEQMNELVCETQKKFTGKKIVISLPLPRKERQLNNKLRSLSAALVSNFIETDNVTCSDNSNLTYRGEPLRGILVDNKHLSRWGTSILARNLRDEVELLIKKIPN